MTSKFTNLLNQLVQEWSKVEYKATNYTNTYSKKSLLKFLSRVEDWTMFQHCAEDRDAMDDIYKLEPAEQVHYETWVEENIDRWAEEDLEERSQRLPESSLQKIRKKWGN